MFGVLGLLARLVDDGPVRGMSFLHAIRILGHVVLNAHS